MTQTLYSPGGNLPFSGRGASQEAGELALNWAVASCGQIQFTSRYSLSGFVYGRGRPPYLVCAATGFRYPQGEMAWVDGRPYIPDFAPSAKDSF